MSSEQHPAAGAPRAVRQRQRQRLIEACISALHQYGPSRTTVEKVVSIAELSPGIVRFYFDSKDAMLVASLAHLAAEFEQRVLEPISRLKDAPVEALERLIELYFDPDLASPKKVSVWYSFWGEASSRQEYQEICGRKDEDFATLVRELIASLIARTDARHLDADAIALGLIGLLEVLWQAIAFQSEREVDREAARHRSRAYLRSVFPGSFPAVMAGHRGPPGRPEGAREASAAAGGEEGGEPLAGWMYQSERLHALERERLFRPSWQVVGHGGELRAAGDYLTAAWPWERVLIVRGAGGSLHALRNACPRLPHALLAERRGHIAGPLRCRSHDLAFELDGRARQGESATPLTGLECARHGPLILARSPGDPAGGPEAQGDWPRAWPALPLGTLASHPVRADWKLLVEQWLDAPSFSGVLLAPNQLLELDTVRPRLLQVLPEAPGRSRLLVFEFRVGRARGATSGTLLEQIALAESAQAALVALPQEPLPSRGLSPMLACWRRRIRELLSEPAS